MPKVTKALEAKFERLNAKVEAAMQAVYASASNNVTPFQTCLINAPIAIKDAYASADRARFDFMLEMAGLRRAWFDQSSNSFARFNWYR
jgi:hypothetical protein